MVPDIQALVNATCTWLQTSWHIQVPFVWLEACVNWLLEEARGTGHPSQQQINQQVLDQWLQTDLRDLDHPVLPGGLSEVQKTEISGSFCVQVDSSLDISQPAYRQLQKWKGNECANDAVCAVTQDTQKPWETKPTRMLMLQLTDGVQSLEGMEYQPIPALNTPLSPGAKLLLQGRIVCRLGVLLLGPANVKVLGGEVEDLAERNNQGRVLCRTLGLPEEQPQEEEVPSGNQEDLDEEFDDQELLASLEAQEQVERIQAWQGQESGYGTLSESLPESSRSSSVRSHASVFSARSGALQSSRDSLARPHPPQDSEESSSLQEITNGNMADEEFPDEDFDDLPLEELEGALSPDRTMDSAQFGSRHMSTALANKMTANPHSYEGARKAQTSQFDRLAHQQIQNGCGSNLGSGSERGCARADRAQLAVVTPKPDSTSAPLPSRVGDPFAIDHAADLMDEDMDCFTEEEEEVHEQQTRLEIEQSTDHVKPLTGGHLRRDDATPALTPSSPPFIYLRQFQESAPHPHPKEMRVKAFIVTLLGKLTSTSGVWQIPATISDGTAYLDVELSNEVLTGLLGFSVSDKESLRRDPARRGELEAGMRRCQEELVDMCCVMTVVVAPDGRRVVSKAEPVNEEVLQELERRVRESRV